MSRRSKYDPTYPMFALEFVGKHGKSINQFAALIGVSRNTIQNWEKAHPEFDEALKLAREWALACWETKLEELIYDRNANVPLIKMLMAIRFGVSDKNIAQDSTPPPSVIVIK